MAKIYETPDDMQRDRLQQNAAQYEFETSSAKSKRDLALSAFFLTLSTSMANNGGTEGEAHTKTQKIASTIFRWAPPIILGSYAALNSIAAKSSGKQLKATKAALETLGQEKIKMPFLADATYVPAPGHENDPPPTFLKKVQEERAAAAAHSSERRI